jgi:hypothetical protein
MADNPSLTSKLRSVFLPERGGSLSEHFRARRWDEFCRRFPDLPDMSVIDLGGYAWNWTTTTMRPKKVLVINLDDTAFPEQPDWISTLTADACELPAELFEHKVDLVFSNSLIEHVGGYWRRAQVAKAVHQLADHHWIQTPARYFPIEPHWVFPLFQFLPVRVRAEASKLWPLSPPEFRAGSLEKNLDLVLEVELVSTAEMCRLYPHSEIYRERVAGLTKSVTAVL